MQPQKTKRPVHQDFLFELFRLCLNDKTDYQIIKKHLDYAYLPNQAYKEVWKHLGQHFLINQDVPTIGILSQHINTHTKAELRDECLIVIERVSETEITGKRDAILSKFESFIQDQIFQEGLAATLDMWNSGKKLEGKNNMKDVVEKIDSLSIFDKSYSTVFGSIDERIEKRIELSKNREQVVSEKRIPFGIPELDLCVRGGAPKGEAYLLAARSGSGKSSFLRHHAISAAKMGFNVVYFALEDNEENFYNYFDAAITGVSLANIEDGLYSRQDFDKIKNGMAGYGEIVFKVFKSFDPVSIFDCRNLLLELKKKMQIDLVLFDYLELFHHEYKQEERIRRIKIAEQVVRLASELDIVCGIATQCSDIEYKSYNDEKFVITRNKIAESKGLPNPFQFFFTLNQTDNEYVNEICRIFIDKARKGKRNQLFTIAQDMSRCRFYDPIKTRNL